MAKVFFYFKLDEALENGATVADIPDGEGRWKEIQYTSSHPTNKVVGEGIISGSAEEGEIKNERLVRSSEISGGDTVLDAEGMLEVLQRMDLGKTRSGSDPEQTGVAAHLDALSLVNFAGGFKPRASSGIPAETYPVLPDGGEPWGEVFSATGPSGRAVVIQKDGPFNEAANDTDEVETSPAGPDGKPPPPKRKFEC